MKKTPALFLFLITALIAVSNNFAQTKPEILTNEKIIQLLKIGLSENVVIEKIRQSECQCDTSTNGLTKLKAAKISDAIILAMLNSSSGSYSETTPPPSRGNSENKIEKESGSINADKSSGKTESLLGKISEPGIYLSENGSLAIIERQFIAARNRVCSARRLPTV